MIFNNAILIKNYVQFTSMLLILLTLSCCRQKRGAVADISDVKIEVSLQRFEKTLFSLKPTVTMDGLMKLRRDFGSFPDLYVKRIIGIPAQNDSSMIIELTKYINDKYITEVYNESQRLYPDVEWIRNELTEAFRYYHVSFPTKNIPNLLTFIAPFNYNILATDSILGIGLDMYLGADYKYYPSTGFPAYKIKKFSKEYIVVDAVNAWLQSDYDVDPNKNDLLNNMVHEGKIIYASSMLLPEKSDSLLFGFNAAQMDWCKKNEDRIWKFFIEQKLLFNKNPGEFIKFINDGATTSGFPAQAPAKIGCYIGWRIVAKYMEQKPDIKLEQLMNENDGNKILMESNYKPERNS